MVANSGAHFWPPDPPCDNPVVCLACCKRREREAVAAVRARIAAGVRALLPDDDILARVLRVVENK